MSILKQKTKFSYDSSKNKVGIIKDSKMFFKGKNSFLNLKEDCMSKPNLSLKDLKKIKSCESNFFFFINPKLNVSNIIYFY